MKRTFRLVTIAAILLSGGLADMTAIAKTSAEVSESDLKEEWPLTVSSGTLHCEPLAGASQFQLVTFTANGKTYWLNGTAGGQAKTRGWSPIDGIWKDDPSNPPAKIMIYALIKRGIDLCN